MTVLYTFGAPAEPGESQALKSDSPSFAAMLLVSNLTTLAAEGPSFKSFLSLSSAAWSPCASP